MSHLYLFLFFLGPPRGQSYYSCSMRETIFRLYCINENGNSILLHIYDYFPYFYCTLPENVDEFKNALENAVRKKYNKEKFPISLKS